MRSLPDEMWMTTLIMSPGCPMARDEAVPVWQTRSFAPWDKRSGLPEPRPGSLRIVHCMSNRCDRQATSTMNRLLQIES